MTDRNELERLLAAATEGPWRLSAGCETEIHAPQKIVSRTYCGGTTGVRLVEAEANAALIVWLRNNAQHDLSLMDEVERLRAANTRIYTIILENSADTPIADNGMTVWDGLQNEARQALTEWRDQ